MGQKTWWQYTRLVLKRAFQRAWNTLGTWGMVAGAIVAIVASILIRQTTSWQDFWEREPMVAALILIGLYLLVVALFVFKEPVIIYNEQAKDLIVYEEQARPKLDIRYIEGVEPYLHVFEHEDGKRILTFRINVLNKSTVTIDDVVVKVVATAPKSLGFGSTELHPTHGVPKRINAKDELSVDVIAVTDFINKERPEKPERIDQLQFYFDDQNLRWPIPIQDYKICVSVSGRGSPAIKRIFRFSVDSDHNCRLVLRKRGKDETKTS